MHFHYIILCSYNQEIITKQKKCCSPWIQIKTNTNDDILYQMKKKNEYIVDYICFLEIIRKWKVFFQTIQIYNFLKENSYTVVTSRHLTL